MITKPKTFITKIAGPSSIDIWHSEKLLAWKKIPFRKRKQIVNPVNVNLEWTKVKYVFMHKTNGLFCEIEHFGSFPVSFFNYTKFKEPINNCLRATTILKSWGSHFYKRLLLNNRANEALIRPN